MGSLSSKQSAAETFLRVDVECQGIQLPREPEVDSFLRDKLGKISKKVSGTDVFHEVYPTMEARLIRRDADVDAGETYRNGPRVSECLEPRVADLLGSRVAEFLGPRPRLSALLRPGHFICAGTDFTFDPFFIPLEGEDLEAARSGQQFNLELRLIHTPRSFRSEVLLGTFCCFGTFGYSSEVLTAEMVPSPDDSPIGSPGCELKLTCTLLEMNATDARATLASSRNCTLNEILSKLTPILASRDGIDSLLKARPTELRSGEESAARAELDKLRQKLQNTMSTLKGADEDMQEDLDHDAVMIRSLKLISRGLLNFSDRFRTPGISDLPELVVQWIKNFFKTYCRTAELSFDEVRLRRLLVAAQVQPRDLEPVQADGEVLAWGGKTDSMSDETWFTKARNINTEMQQAVVGKGAYGCVWRARSKLTGALYAIKNVIPPDNDNQKKHIAEREAEILKYLLCAERHPCVVDLFFVGCDESESMYAHVMELCSGGDLQGRINHGIGHSGSYTVPPLAKTWISEIFLALAYLFLDKKVLHRDVKPSNVVLNKNIAKLADFGLTDQVEKVEERFGNWTFNFPPGSYCYCAPEVILGQPYDEKADLYSFAVLSWVLLTGGVNVAPGKPPSDPLPNYADDWRQMEKCVKEVVETKPCVNKIHITESSSEEASHRIERVSFLYSDGRTRICGGDEGQPSSKGEFLLEKGEYIKEVVQKGQKGNRKRWPPAMIQFVTNTGRVSPVYGDESASEDYLPLLADKEKQIFRLHCGNGRLNTVQDWARQPQGLVPLSSKAKKFLLPLVNHEAEKRPDHNEIWQHNFFEQDLPNIHYDVELEERLEEIENWIVRNTPSSE